MCKEVQMERYKRIGIFSIDNMEYALGEDIFYLLCSMKKYMREIYIVCNGKLQYKEKEHIKKYSNLIFENVFGYDVNRWNYILQIIISKTDADEIILFNDSFFGPLFSLDNMFHKMEFEEIDFWGITDSEIVKSKKNERYLQTYFMAFKKSAYIRKAFKKYWEKLPRIKNLDMYQKFVDEKLTSILISDGLKYATYIDTPKAKDKDRELNYILIEPKYLVKAKKMPFISKHAFAVKKEVMLNYNTASEISGLMEYVENCTIYDAQIIYKYFINRLNIYDLKLLFNKNCIITQPKSTWVRKISKIAIYAHLYYEDLFEYAVSYLVKIPDYIDIYISTSCEEKKEQIESELKKRTKRKVKILISNRQGREWSAFLMEAKKYLLEYDLFCMIHDKKSSQMFFETVGRHFCDVLWDNLLFDTSYIEGVVELFENNQEIGLAVPPNVYHGTFFHTSIDFWTICYKKVEELADRLNISTDLDRKKPPIALGTAFWGRTDALKELLEYPFTYEDFPKEPMDVDGTVSHALERIIPYVAQNNQYYTVTIMNKRYAEADIVNKDFINRNILSYLKDKMPVMTIENLLIEIQKEKENE